MDRAENLDSAPGAQGERAFSLEDWLSSSESGAALVLVPGDADLEGSYERLLSASRIIIELPVFMDGRAFSLARKLRDQGFTGPLLAGGDVLPDQWQFLERCGFSGLANEALGEEAKDLRRFSDAYQGDVTDERPIFRRVERG